MNVYINNLSALWFYCMVETSLDSVSKPCTKTRVTDAASALSEIRAIDLTRFDFGRGTLHVLVGDAASRGDAAGIKFHVRSIELPLGAFRRLDSGIYLASPELCFFELACSLPFPKLVEFGYLLCGTYTLNPAAKKKNGRSPLTTKRRLESFVLRMGDSRGRATALRALTLVLEESASPRETKLAILLTFPVRLGGYHFEAPILNYRIDFTKAEQELFGKSYVELDSYWPAFHCGIEYDGNENHSKDEDVSNDRKKSSELNYRGITVIRVDKQQLSSPYQVYVLARKLQKLMKIPHRKPTDAQWQRKEELFDIIMR